MALFKKKTEDQELKKQQELRLKQQQEQKVQMMSPFEVHVMPQKFLGEAPSAKDVAGKKSRVGVVLVIAIVILALLAVGAWQLYVALNPAPIPQVPVNNTPVNNAPATNPLINNAPVNNEAANNVPVNNVPVNNAPGNNAPVNNAPVNNAPVNNAPVNQPVQYQSSLDVDRDGLTDVEEDLYGTQLRLPDTDGDGYTDGQELLSGYSPLSSGPVLLSDTALMNTYLNDAFGYSLLYPSSWLARPTDESRQEIVFVSSTGEVMSFKVRDNASGVSLNQWLVDNSAGNPSDFTSFANRAKLNVLVNASQMKYFIDVPASSKVIEVTYEPNQVIRLNFITTLRAMVNSLSVR